ncbi:MAG: HD domain-containing protein [Thermoleophilia bacterium]|nr:HD domain-containing protein [Thermoleophilia bacterium]
MTDPLAALRPPLAAAAPGGWIVGGALRDAALGAPVRDVDLAVPGDAGDAARRLASATGAARFPLSGAFGSWRLTGGSLGVQVDITPLQGTSIEEDLARRDFTVNAMAVPVSGPAEVVDPTGGAADARAGVLRAASGHALDDDPVRVLRAVRIGQGYGLAIDGATRAACRRSAPRLWDAPGERLRAEVYAMARLPRADLAFAGLDDLGGLGVLVPELEDGRGMEQNAFHHRDVLGHTLAVVENGCAIAADPSGVFRDAAPAIARDLAELAGDDVTRREVMVLSCLLHDMAKPATRAVAPDGRVTFMHHDTVGADAAAALMERLRAARRVVEAVAACVRWHLVIGFMIHLQPLSLRQLDRFFRTVGTVDTESFALSAADRLATRGVRSRDAQLRRHLRLVYELAAVRPAWRARAAEPPVLRGDEIARIVGRAPGPWLADAVERLRVEQLMRPGMTVPAARRFVRGLIPE